MACTQDFIDFIITQLAGAGTVRAQKMFGEWGIYVDEKMVIMACDNIAYVKKLPELEPLMHDAECGYPYPGAKEHYILDIEHRDHAIQVVRLLAQLLPYPKKKKAKA